MNDGDKFLFNKEFTAKLHRIRINSIQLKETSEENEKTHEAVFRDRQYQVRTRIRRQNVCVSSRPFWAPGYIFPCIFDVSGQGHVCVFIIRAGRAT